MPAPIPAPPATLVSSDLTYDAQPALASDAEGNPWGVWVGFERKVGDRVYAAQRDADGWGEARALTPEAGNYVRPVIERLGTGMVALWTATGDETSIWMSRCASPGQPGSEWTPPERVSPPGHHHNPETCVDPDGRLWMAWQSHDGTGYDIFLASFDGELWSEPLQLSDHPGNDWDPTIASDDNGKLWVVWSGFRDADYDLFCVSLEHGQPSAERRLTDHTAYDLHPWVCIDGEGRPWIAWDHISIPDHASSGEAVEVDGVLINRGVESGHVGWHDGEIVNPASVSRVEVRCLTGGELVPPAAALPPIRNGFQLKHCAYPKLEVDSRGTLWLAMRAWRGRVDEPHVFWWDALVLNYAEGVWSVPRLLETSDGYLEEPSIVAHGDSVWVAAQMEHRRTAPPNHPHPEQGPTSYEFDHHWVEMPQGTQGEVYVTRFDAQGSGSAPELGAPEPLADGPSLLAQRWVPHASTTYEIEYAGQRYSLLFGDTHKHSNVSRCSTGNEPTVDDRYRFSQDVCQHDFFVMSDHSNQTSDFNWWTIAKTADLYYVPGSFATLFGYEISNGFPVGHKNVILPERPTEILRIGLDRASTGREIWSSLAGTRAITIPHTPAQKAGTDWSEHDPAYERVVEIFQSVRGSSEHVGAPRVHGPWDNTAGFVHEALNKGHRMGFIASTDHGFGAAYAVVYATGVTRDEVFEGLFARRCYASTSRDIVLDFRANGHLMGEEITASEPASLSIMARAQTPLERLDLFRDQEIVASFGPDEVTQQGAEWRVEWTDPAAAEGTRTYYVRVMLSDKELAWSSPIWVTYE